MSMHFERKKETGSPAGSQGLSHKRQRPVALSPTFRCWSNTRTGRALSWWGKPGGGGGGAQDTGPNGSDRRSCDPALEEACSSRGSPETQSQEGVRVHVERDRFVLGTGSRDCGGRHVHSPRSAVRRAGQRPGEAWLLQFESQGHLLAEFPPPPGTSVFFFKAINRLGEAHLHYEGVTCFTERLLI